MKKIDTQPIIKEEDIAQGRGFVFPSKAVVAEIWISQDADLYKGHLVRYVDLKMDILMAAYESPFGAGIVPEQRKSTTVKICLPWLAKVHIKVGDTFNCAWKDGFGMNGTWAFQNLYPDRLDWGSPCLNDTHNMMWVKTIYLEDAHRIIDEKFPHWEWNGNWVIFPMQDYSFIYQETIPRKFFLEGALRGPFWPTKTFVDVTDPEEGFYKAVPIQKKIALI